MPHTWFVTFVAPKRGVLPKRRNPRITRTFETEAEAKDFAREKFNEGLSVHAGTLNPYSPRQLICSGDMPSWLHDTQQSPGGAQSEES
jgi:hypothetical protein